ncbi:uncharacterized protein ACA1_250290 [Acanthamoeba castellanii str. Neff]|uniref:Uncharacterized protein n=1 Tax=Acanthamoeba castellanii (strain ATCC 30010 / Neff) TaxID=1257118 RepID=L8HD93_ACACF|nr:uncharacterized protein ACA1_250290 [Acanthamoeba castellanii str. Neff]ELR23135.1 hypothetical protein ACA1_250290 [Acanthamoeba castellanii str. Neff]
MTTIIHSSPPVEINRVRSSSHPTVSLGSSTSSPAATPRNARRNASSSSSSSSSTSAAMPSSSSSSISYRGSLNLTALWGPMRSSSTPILPCLGSKDSVMDDGGGAGPCSKGGCGCKKYRPNPWRRTVCCNCQHSFDSHELLLISEDEDDDIDTNEGEGAERRRATMRRLLMEGLGSGGGQAELRAPRQQRLAAPRRAIRPSSARGPHHGARQLRLLRRGAPLLRQHIPPLFLLFFLFLFFLDFFLYFAVDFIVVGFRSFEFKLHHGLDHDHERERVGADDDDDDGDDDARLGAGLSAQMMRNLSPEVQRLLLSSAEGRLLEDDELEVIAEEGDDDETEAEVDEQVEEPDFLSSSPQPKANPRFSPRHLFALASELTPEFLRPFSAPKRSLLRHGARATPEAEAEAEERRQRRHHEKEMRTSWELMIDTLVKPPTGAAETDDDDTKWLRQRQRADTNTESETITGDQGSDDNDDIGTSDDGWEVGDIDTTGEEEVEELVIIPTTFKAREETKFTLAAFADVPLQLREYTGPKPPSALLGSRH